jgi:hypothetical protein
MKKLKDILTVRTRTSDLLILEVIPNSQIDLIENGFDGNERMFRLQVERTRSGYGENKYYTPFFGNGNIIDKGYTFEWGGITTTCVSDEFRRQRDMIVAVAHELGFKI